MSTVSSTPIRLGEIAIGDCIVVTPTEGRMTRFAIKVDRIDGPTSSGSLIVAGPRMFVDGHALMQGRRAALIRSDWAVARFGGES